MLRRDPLIAAAAFLLFPGLLMAGGPPRLCLPIDAAAAAPAGSIADVLNEKLPGKLISDNGPYGRTEVVRHRDQNYLAFYFAEDLRLSDVDAALKKAGFHIPRDRLRLFGHAILEFELGDVRPKELLTAIETLDHVAVIKSVSNSGRLLVTVDVPYPVLPQGQSHRDSVGWDKFERNEYSSIRPTKNEPQATADTLPSYNALRDVAAAHKVSLKDVVWSTEYACRAVGAVAAREHKSVASLEHAR